LRPHAVNMQATNARTASRLKYRAKSPFTATLPEHGREEREDSRDHAAKPPDL
jgi:hypothetical protein